MSYLARLSLSLTFINARCIVVQDVDGEGNEDDRDRDKDVRHIAMIWSHARGRTFHDKSALLQLEYGINTHLLFIWFNIENLCWGKVMFRHFCKAIMLGHRDIYVRVCFVFCIIFIAIIVRRLSFSWCLMFYVLYETFVHSNS